MEYFEGECFDKVINEEAEYDNLGFSDCSFYNCSFLDISVIESRFSNCEFHNCIIGNIKFTNVNALNCQFINCILIGIDWSDLQEGKLVPFSEFNKCTLRYNYFINFNLMKQKYDGCTFEGCTFEQCNLSEASFRDTELSETRFIQNDLRKCDFSNAQNYSINIKENLIKQAKFSFPEAINLLKELEIIVE